jgi:predicted nucleic acid-binding protein
MTLVADTGPLNYLILTGAAFALPRIFTRIVVTPSVVAELMNDGAPGLVRGWIDAPPEWLVIQETSAFDMTSSVLSRADLEVISLARELKVPLLIDDREGRKFAAAHEVETIGTIGFLELASTYGFVDLPTVLAKLSQTNHRHSDALVKNALTRFHQRKNQHAE